MPNKKNLRPDLLERQRRPGPQVQRAVHVRHGRPGLQHEPRPAGTSSQHRRPVGSRVQGPGQLAYRDAGRARAVMLVAGQLTRRSPPRGASSRRSTRSRSRRTRARSGASPATTTPMTSRRATSLAQAYSGDVAQLQADNPDLQFVVPESGGTSSRHHGDPLHDARTRTAAEPGSTTSTTGPTTRSWSPVVQYVPVLSDMTEELDEDRPGRGQEPADQPADGHPGQVEGLAAAAERRADSGVQHRIRRGHRRLTRWQA